MNSMKTILFVMPAQYGYHTDSYKYCELLSEKYDVVYLGIYVGKPIRESKSVHIYHIDISRCYFWRYSMLKQVFLLKRKHSFDVSFIYSFPLCSLFLFLLGRDKTLMDIRTSFVEGKFKSKILNCLLTIESCMFKRISVISWGVADFLHLNLKKCRLLPLGGDKVPFYPKKKFPLSLLYVGTFYDRFIETTVQGVAIFIKNNPLLAIKYTIIGFGTESEVKKIQHSIEEYHLEGVVTYVGERRHEELIPYFKSHNIGVSYIPLTDYYDCQPPTKTYEYLLNSMLVLATPTSENAKVINVTNGILSEDDSAESFSKGLEKLYAENHLFNFKSIYLNAQRYTWNNIVDRYLVPLIENV